MENPNIRFKGFTKDWEQRKFSDIASRESVSRESSYDLPSLEYEDVIAEEGRLNKDISLKENIKKGIVFDGSQVLYGKLRPYLHNWLNPDFSGVAVGDWWVLKPNNADKSFIYRLIQTQRFDDIANKSAGSKMPRADWNLVSNTEFAVPVSQEEQEKIGEYFSSLDHLITLHQRKCEQTKNLKKYMLQKMFPQNGAKVPEIRFNGFTHDWEQRKFGSLLEETRNKTIFEDEDTLLSCAIDGMYLNSELFSHFRGSSNIGYLKVKKNDLILSAQNLHLGNCNVNLRFEHGIISPAYKVYELVGCNPLFMQAWVKKDSTKDFFLKSSTEGASVCRKNIVWEELYKQELPVPSIEEQTKVGEYFYSLDHLITLHQRKCDELKKMKKFMLQNMFI